MPIDLGVPKLQKDRFKFQVGENKVRVLDLSTDWHIAHFSSTGSVQCGNDIFGEGPCKLCADKKSRSAKKIAYLYDYASQKVVLAFLPKTIVNELQSLSEQAEYDYSSFPMPYDIKVVHDPKAAAKDQYKTYAGRTNSPVNSEVTEDLEKRKPLDQIMESIRSKQSPAEETEDIGVIAEFQAIKDNPE